MRNNNNSKNIVIVAHKFLTQPDDDLFTYLNDKKYKNVLHIRHSFSDAPDRTSYFTWFKEGKLFKEAVTKDYKFLPEPLIYAKELFFTLKWLFSFKNSWNTYIGVDGLCVLYGLFAKGVKKINKVVYWAIDFVPEDRFAQKWKNLVYRNINKFGYKYASEIWDLSPRMKEARAKFLWNGNSPEKNHKIVPYGVWLNKIKHYSYEECEKNTIVFMGHLIEKQGVQVVIRNLPKLLKKNSNIRLKIIGGGIYRDVLENLARELDVLDSCDFLGVIPAEQYYTKLLPEIAKSCIAVAPYIKSLDRWTYYADPGKIKTYLACGVPVLMPNISWNSAEIADSGCAKLLSDDLHDINEKIEDLMLLENNQSYRDNAIKYAHNFDYGSIFEELNL